MAEPLTLYKLIILYMLDKVTFPLTTSQVSEFILDKGYTTYFHLQQALSDLADSSLIESKSIRNASHLYLTKTGRETIMFFEKEISPEIRSEIEQHLTNNAYELRNEVDTLADYFKESANEYTVRCQIKERGRHLLDLQLSVPTEETARSICNKWTTKSDDVYAYLMQELL